MAAVVLDTTVVIDLLRGRHGAAERLRELQLSGDEPCICAVSVEEAVAGLRPGEKELAESLFGGLRIAPLGRHEGWVAGEWRQGFGGRGVTLSQADCLIGAAALSVGGRLATGNPKHFPMPELDVKEWPVGL